MTVKNLKIIFFLPIVFLFAACRPTTSVNSSQVIVSVNGHNYLAQIAKTDQERERGLSDRESLGAGQGMLFVFDKPDAYGFWMKDMKFPLDIIWINGNTVVDIKSNLPPEGHSPALIYKPQAPADYVLEINQGEVEKNGFKIGDKVEIKFD